MRGVWILRGVYLAALIFVGHMAWSLGASVMEKARAEHVGHEAQHEAMLTGLSTVEAGDLIVMEGGHLFMAKDVPRNYGQIYIRGNAPDAMLSVAEERSFEQLVLQHPRVVKQDTPEYGEELAKYFRIKK